MQQANLALRFLLELAALYGFGALAWTFGGTTLIKIVLAAVAVGIAAAIWGTFNVPGDPSRSGNAPVVVPGVLRLAIELAILFSGAYALHMAGMSRAAIVLAVLITLHYALSGERIGWLLAR